jgi:hypothetical protein
MTTRTPDRLLIECDRCRNHYLIRFKPRPGEIFRCPACRHGKLTVEDSEKDNGPESHDRNRSGTPRPAGS